MDYFIYPFTESTLPIKFNLVGNKNINGNHLPKKSKTGSSLLLTLNWKINEDFNENIAREKSLQFF